MVKNKKIIMHVVAENQNESDTLKRAIGKITDKTLNKYLTVAANSGDILIRWN
jgi:DNA-binding HxlR family transcriptional regulator